MQSRDLSQHRLRTNISQIFISGLSKYSIYLKISKGYLLDRIVYSSQLPSQPEGKSNRATATTSASYV